MAPSEKMAAIGIVQEGDPILREVAPPFDLLAEAEDARRVIADLHAAIRRADTIHNFAKGMGVAAPQLGISRAAAVVLTPAGEYITLLILKSLVSQPKPTCSTRVAGPSSTFVARCHDRSRSRSSSRRSTATARIAIFDHAVARLVAHEIDHLKGKLFTDQMGKEMQLIPVSQYDGTSRPWTY